MIDYQKLQDRRPKRLYCCFRLWVVAIARGQLLHARRGWILQICRWNCHPICHSSRDISISGFGASLPFPVVGYCRNHLLTMTLHSRSPCSKIPDLRLEFWRYLLQPICHTVEDISTSGFDGHIVISRYPSMSHLFVDTFFEFGVVNKAFRLVKSFVYCSRISELQFYFRFIRLYESVTMTVF